MRLMSKLDRQLDDVYGEARVVIRWPRGEEIDVDAVRNQLIEEIDHHRAIPLPC
jgi:hypothetical protein